MNELVSYKRLPMKLLNSTSVTAVDRLCYQWLLTFTLEQKRKTVISGESMYSTSYEELSDKLGLNFRDVKNSLDVLTYLKFIRCVYQSGNVINFTVLEN